MENLKETAHAGLLNSTSISIGTQTRLKPTFKMLLSNTLATIQYLLSTINIATTFQLPDIILCNFYATLT